MVIGFILRIAYRGALDSIGIYAVMTLFILLSVRRDFLSPLHRSIPKLTRSLISHSPVLSLRQTTCS
jgi:hypothetical protein